MNRIKIAALATLTGLCLISGAKAETTTLPDYMAGLSACARVVTDTEAADCDKAVILQALKSGVVAVPKVKGDLAKQSACNAAWGPIKAAIASETGNKSAAYQTHMRLCKM